jgi:SAM-dependent methyltransferase
MLAVARRNLAPFGNVEVLSMQPFGEREQANLPLPDGSVDAAFANMVLHHAPNPAAAIAEMARIVKPGGRLILTDLNPHAQERLREEMADLWLGFDREEIRGWFEAAGLREVIVNPTGQRCCPAPAPCCDGPPQASCCDAPQTPENATTFVAVGVKVAM